MMPSFARDTVTVHRAPMIEERGTKVRDWANAQKHVIERCSFQPVQSSTNWTDPRQAVTVKASLYLPPGSDITEEDMVEFGGAKYAVEGAPFEWRSPSGRIDHVQASLVDWRG